MKKIGVMGVGMVGAQVKRWFESQKFPVFAFDKFKGIGAEEDLQKADIIFLCLPTAHDKKYECGVDLSIFETAVKKFKNPKKFIIKSTIPPGTTDYLQKKFPKHYFFHSPEFLTEATAWDDFSEPILQPIGYTKKSQKFADEILKIMPPAKLMKIMPAIETEIFKFARNAFFAMKVIFANEVYDLCKKLGADYDNLKEMMLIEPWIGGQHLTVIHKGYRGFGGKCLPKDLKTLIKVFKKNGIEQRVFSAVDKANDKLIEKQGLTKTLKKYWLGNFNEPKK